MSPRCPYCGARLRKKPKRRSKCPDCGYSIHVRHGQQLVPSELCTETDAWALDLLASLNRFGLTEADCHERLESAVAEGEPMTLHDAVWDLAEQKRKSLDDKRERLELMHPLSIYLSGKGERESPEPGEVMRQELERLAAKGAERVRILGAGVGSCPACQKVNNKVMSIKLAIKKQLLPVDRCTTRGGCQCFYARER